MICNLEIAIGLIVDYRNKYPEGATYYKKSISDGKNHV